MVTKHTDAYDALPSPLTMAWALWVPQPWVVPVLTPSPGLWLPCSTHRPDQPRPDSRRCFHQGSPQSRPVGSQPPQRAGHVPWPSHCRSVSHSGVSKEGLGVGTFWAGHPVSHSLLSLAVSRPSRQPFQSCLAESSAIYNSAVHKLTSAFTLAPHGLGG